MVGFMKSALNLLGIKKDGDSAVAVGLDDFLQTLPGLMGYDIRFKKEEREGRPHYEIEGNEVDSLLAECPNILEALSHVSMRIIRKGEGASNTPQTEGEGMGAFFVSFDANGFRDRKNTDLRELAAEQRKKVLDNGGKPAYISALSPAERKVIHTHLLELGDVVSESIGKGNFKRIRVRLKDDSPLRRQRPQNANGEQQPRDRGPRRGPGPGGQGGGNNNNGGGRGPRGGGQGRRQEFGPTASNNPNRNQGGEVNGNRVVKDTDNDIDDNIGNRLAPGEESPFFSSSFNSSSDPNRSN